MTARDNLLTMLAHEVDTLLYHSPCIDGFAAAWVASRYALANDREIDLIPVVHGAPPPNVRGRRVLIVDFSYPRPVLQELRSQAADLLVLDHHSEAEKQLVGLSYTQFDQNRSGAGLAWDFFFPGRKAPPIITYIQDRDLWKFDHGDATMEWHAYISMFPFDVGAWTSAAEDSYDDLTWRPIGRGILRSQAQMVRQLVADATVMSVYVNDETLWRWRMPVANVTRHFVSEVGNLLTHGKDSEPLNFPAALLWSYDKRGYVCSLRGTDAGEIATLLGGGGHARAGGFRATGIEITDDHIRVRVPAQPPRL